MQFHLDETQLALQDAVRTCCADIFSLERVAEREGRAAADSAWSTLADLGVLSMLVPGAVEGVGLVEATIAFEELGAHLSSGPLIWSTIAAPCIADIATGRVRVAGALAQHPDGLPVVVEHGGEADVVVVVHPDRVEAVASADLGSGTTREPLDPLTPVLVLDSMPSGPVVGDEGLAHQMGLQGTILSAAALVGCARGALDVARNYALEREQFGVPIGSFQAIKHLLADMYVKVEMARAETYAAAAMANDPRSGDPSVSSSAAKVLAGDAAFEQLAGRRADTGRHGLHLGHAAPLLPQAIVGAGAHVRHRVVARVTSGCGRRCRGSITCRRRRGDGVSDTIDGVAVEATDGVLRINLGRPERKNALDPAAIGRIVEALEQASTDETLRVVLICSSGDDFCAGANWVATNDAQGMRPRTGSIQRRTPSAGAPVDRAARRDPAPGGVPGKRLGGGSWVPDRAGRRFHRGR